MQSGRAAGREHHAAQVPGSLWSQRCQAQAGSLHQGAFLHGTLVFRCCLLVMSPCQRHPPGYQLRITMLWSDLSSPTAAARPWEDITWTGLGAPSALLSAHPVYREILYISKPRSVYQLLPGRMGSIWSNRLPWPPPGCAHTLGRGVSAMLLEAVQQNPERPRAKPRRPRGLRVSPVHLGHSWTQPKRGTPRPTLRAPGSNELHGIFLFTPLKLSRSQNFIRLWTTGYL